nr:gliding motility-associated C-terminal domain-containing protein [Sediminibacterium sp.]
AVYAIPTVGAITGTNNVCVDKTVILSTNNVAGGSGIYNYYYWFDNRELVSQPFTNPTVQITGITAGPATITYKVRDSRGCFSNFSPDFPFLINPLPIAPIAVNVNQVYDGLLHTAGANAANPSTEQLSWYLNNTGNNPTVPPSATNVGPTITSFVESTNVSTGCVSAYRTPVTVDILPKGLNITANDKTKLYDAQVYNGGYDVTYDGFVNGESENTGVLIGTLSYTGTAIAATNAGTYAIVPTGLSALNYAINFINGALRITTKQLTISGVSVANKIYDGTDVATITSASLNGVAPADVSFVQLNRVAKFPTKNVGNNLVITSYSTLTGTSSITSNYVLDPTIIAFASITPKTIDASGFITVDKVYDATTVANVTGGVLRTAIAAGTGTSTDKSPYIGDALNIQPAGYFTNKNVANGISILSTTTISGTDANNYFLETPILTARNITPKNLSMFGLSVAATKIYDATNSAAVLGTPQFFNAIAPGSGTAVDGFPYTGDVISFVGTPTATYNSKDVLTASSVQYTGLVVAGPQANNYTLTMQPNSAATILPKHLTMSGLVVPASKVYDGTTNAVVTGVPVLQTTTVAGTGSTTDGKPYFGDQVAITGTPIAQYNTQHVFAIFVRFTGLSLSGTASSNYELDMQSDANANITPLDLNVRANPQTKKYGAIDPVLTYTHDPLIPGDLFAGVLTRAVGEAIGQYAIGRGSLDLGVDYTIYFIGDTLSIVPVDLYIKPNTVKRVYGDDPLLDGLETNNFTAIGLQFAETLGTIKLYFESGFNSGNNKKDSIGLYLNKVEPRDLTAGNADFRNYNIIYQLGDLEVDKYDLSIIADDKLKRESEVDPPLTYQLGNALIIGDTLSGALTRAIGITPGLYQIQQGSLRVNNNYNILYTPGYLTILTIKNVFVVPTAFTPNNDGLNDVLSILHNPNVAGLIYFKIYNRAGNLVYQTNTLAGAWDGRVGGAMQDADAFFWTAEFVTWNNLNVKQKGTFLLIK